MSTEPLPAESRRIWAWQSRLLPFVVVVLSLLTLFACVANVVQVYHVETHIEKPHDVNIDDILSVAWLLSQFGGRGRPQVAIQLLRTPGNPSGT